jgi:hypothetical protein
MGTKKILKSLHLMSPSPTLRGGKKWMFLNEFSFIFNEDRLQSRSND